MNGFQKKRVLEALDNLEHLSDWENDFINSIAEQDEEIPLTEKQNSVLNRISETVGKVL